MLDLWAAKSHRSSGLHVLLPLTAKLMSHYAQANLDFLPCAQCSAQVRSAALINSRQDFYSILSSAASLVLCEIKFGQRQQTFGKEPRSLICGPVQGMNCIFNGDVDSMIGFKCSLHCRYDFRLLSHSNTLGIGCAGLQASTVGIISLGGRVPQIWMNYRRGNSGELSSATCALNLAGNAARVFTTFILTKVRLQLGFYMIRIVHSCMCACAWSEAGGVCCLQVHLLY